MQVWPWNEASASSCRDLTTTSSPLVNERLSLVLWLLVMVRFVLVMAQWAISLVVRGRSTWLFVYMEVTRRVFSVTRYPRVYSLMRQLEGRVSLFYRYCWLHRVGLTRVGRYLTNRPSAAAYLGRRIIAFADATPNAINGLGLLVADRRVAIVPMVPVCIIALLTFATLSCALGLFTAVRATGTRAVHNHPFRTCAAKRGYEGASDGVAAAYFVP
jgi:hypothetical protein